jgi:hypothetical protein
MKKDGTREKETKKRERKREKKEKKKKERKERNKKKESKEGTGDRVALLFSSSFVPYQTTSAVSTHSHEVPQASHQEYKLQTEQVDDSS